MQFLNHFAKSCKTFQVLLLVGELKIAEEFHYSVILSPYNSTLFVQVCFLIDSDGILERQFLSFVT